MLVAAFVGWTAGSLPDPGRSAPTRARSSGRRRPSSSALLRALLAAVVVSLVHAWLSISVKADQIISGTIINIAALGITGYLNTSARPSPRRPARASSRLRPADGADQPAVRRLDLRHVPRQGPITISLLVIVVAFQIALFRTRWGLRSRAVGEHPRAAETVGIDVIRLRYRNVMLGGVLAGLGGAFLSMEQTATRSSRR